MRVIQSSELLPQLVDLCTRVNQVLSDDVKEHLLLSKDLEDSEMGNYVFDEIIDNASCAESNHLPLCQDTGASIFFVQWGQECVLEGSSLQDLFNEAVRLAYTNSYYRKSIVSDPLFDRKNTEDNTPAFIHLESVPGDRVCVTFLPKGAGADTCSQYKMLYPSHGIEGVKEFVLKVCKEAGASSCPPWVIGVGIGGTFDTVASYAKHALLRELGSEHPDERYQVLEKNLKDEINALGIGPQGLGGTVSALAVHIKARPCHAATLPVAVNIQCHSHRKGSIVF